MSINSTSPRERWGFGVDILTGRIFVMSPVLRYDEERHVSIITPRILPTRTIVPNSRIISL